MSDYTMVLNGLRHCINLDGLEPNDTRIRCHGCPYFTEPTRCGGILMRDAAAAIEELQKTLKAVQENSGINFRMWQEAQAEVERLQAQLPKPGEWVEQGEPPMLVIECSVCGQKYFRHFTQDKAKYCSMCGAKMDGERKEGEG